MRAKSSLQDITKKQKKTWSSGDFNQIARQNWAMAENLCNTINPNPSKRVLDIACGSGTAALVFERRYCDVTGLDYVPELIDRAKWRAEANGQTAEFIVGDAQDLPFEDNSFDIIVSIYGVQFAPDQEKAASEMLRVCKPGGTIGLAGPVPEGWSGDIFSTHAKYSPPPPGLNSPLRWGTNEGISQLLEPGCSSIKTIRSKAIQYYRSTDHAIQVFSKWFGPTVTTSEKLEPKKKQQFLKEVKAVFERYNTATDGTAVVENIYLTTLATCR